MWNGRRTHPDVFASVRCRLAPSALAVALLVLAACAPAGQPRGSQGPAADKAAGPAASPATTTSTAPIPAASSAAAAQPVKRITILHLADTHGKVDTHPEFFLENGKPVFRQAGGIARIATLVKQVRAEQPGRVMLFNVGDTFFTSGITALSNGQATVPIFNALDIDAWTPGNWDFQPNKRAYEERLKLIKFPVLAMNLYDAETGQRRHDPYLVKEIDGVKVGVIGMTSIKVIKEMAPAVGKGWRFTFKEGLVETIRELKQRQKADVLILLSELGLAQEVQLAKELEGSGLDFILGAETHERTFEPVVSGGIPVVQSGSEGSFLGRLDVTVQGGRVTGYQWKLIEIEPSKYAPDPEIQRLVDEAKAPYKDKLSQVVGRTETVLYRNNVLETTVDNFITDAVREYTGADITMTRAFRYGHPVMPGDITLDDLYNMLPVNPKLRVGRITGQQYLDRMEDLLERVFSADAFRQSGGWIDRSAGTLIRFTANAPPGKRLVEVLVNGKPIDPNGSYTIAACAREGDPPDALCQINQIKDARTLDVRAHDVLIAYLRKHSPIKPDFQDRIQGGDLPRRLWSQFYKQ